MRWFEEKFKDKTSEFYQLPVVKVCGSPNRLKRMKPENWDIIESQTSPFALYLDCMSLKKSDIDRLSQQKNIVFLSNEQNLTLKAGDYDSLTNLSLLKAFNFTSNYFCKGPEAYDFLTEFPLLKYLSLSDSDSLCEHNILKFQNIKSLEYLDISSFKAELTENAVEAISHITQLKELIIKTFDGDLDKCFSYINRLVNLECLKVEKCNDCILLLQDLNLRSLSLVACDEFTKKGLEILKNMSRLENLDLQCNNQLTDDDLPVLKHLYNLRFLNLLLCKKLSDKCLHYLSHLTALEELNFSCTNSHDLFHGIQHNLINLHTLHIGTIDSGPVSKNGILSLRSLPKLKNLYLDGEDRISSDSDFLLLTEIPSLRFIDISKNMHITDEGLGQFHKLLPKCKIRFLKPW